MDSRNLAIGIIFLLQTTVGTLGNFYLLIDNLVFHQNKRKLMPMDLILIHMFMVNSLILLFKGLPNTLALFDLKQFFNDWSYQLFLYILRVFRSMSIATIAS